MRHDWEQKLLTEREKLDRMVGQALEHGTPISETHGVMEQCRKVERLIEIVGKTGSNLRFLSPPAHARQYPA